MIDIANLPTIPLSHRKKLDKEDIEKLLDYFSCDVSDLFEVREVKTND